MRYQAVINPNNKNNSHSLTIDFIADASGGDSLEILDVGCSAGYLGEYLRGQGHHVTGIDITSEAIEKASEFLNEAYCMKVEDYFSTHSSRRFDIVIFGDVLEHVTNAKEVLERTSQALKPGGRVIASIPNVGHLAVRAMLLEGRWEYANLGLLDRDHVRFFTKKSIENLFSEAGLDVNEMRTTNLSVNTVDKMCGMNLNPKFINIARKAAAGDETAEVFQYIAMAQLKSNAPRIVCLLPEMNSGLFELRIKTPLDNWARRYGRTARFLILGKQTADDILWGDVFVFERMAGAYTLHLMTELKRYGKRVVFEIDDLLTELPDFLSHHRVSPDQQKSLKEVIAKADLVTTTTPRLAAQLISFNSNVVCVPNCIKNTPSKREAHNNYSHPKSTIIIASSDTVMVDIIIEPLRYIQEKYGEQVKLVVVGPIDRELDRGGVRFERIPVQSYSNFTKLLGTLVNPIGLIPLDESIFSSCKSPIKYFDYGSASIPTICSNVPPYSDYIVDQHSGLLVANESEAWKSALDMLIQSASKRKIIGQAAFDYVTASCLADQAGDAWQSVIKKRRIDSTVTDSNSLVGLIESTVLVVKPQSIVKSIAYRILNVKTYSKLLAVVREEGFAGVLRRLDGLKNYRGK